MKPREYTVVLGLLLRLGPNKTDQVFAGVAFVLSAALHVVDAIVFAAKRGWFENWGLRWPR